MDRPDSLYTFFCTICDQTFHQIPPGAMEIGHTYNSRITTYVFPDGVTHFLRKRKKTVQCTEETKDVL